ncbi:unnamed protein product [Medioppia subpectinata]|uniref:Cytochrome P450 n=1 Tax=Medioppia subpectinata TaxID=1979941 RepID=A0A7R9LB62_9ACAR|nr:unnamed protein product [Medioppia subpectinata]CAG2117058.1 unnamed protein product [Medioppia subpectinata]
MILLTNMMSLLVTDIRTSIITLTIGYIVYKLAKFYYLRSKLPPGPHPVPLMGNLLLFKSKDHWDVVFRQLAKKYGPVFTFWFGTTPQLIITDTEMAREAFRKNDMAGRPESYFGAILSNEKYKDVAFTDYGHTWEALRRVSHSALQYVLN